MWNGLGYIIPIVIFSVLYNLVKFLELETVHIRKTLFLLKTRIRTVKMNWGVVKKNKNNL
jgi:hypothetical protein